MRVQAPCVYCGQYTLNIGGPCENPKCVEAHRDMMTRRTMVGKTITATRVNHQASIRGNRQQRRAQAKGAKGVAHFRGFHPWKGLKGQTGNQA